MSICDCFGDSLMAPTLSSVDSESHLAQLKHFLIISFTRLYNNIYILFFTHSFIHSINIDLQFQKVGSPGVDTEMEFEEQSIYEGLISVKEGGRSRTRQREKAYFNMGQAEGQDIWRRCCLLDLSWDHTWPTWLCLYLFAFLFLG